MSSDIIFIGEDFNSRVETRDDFIIESKNNLDYLLQDYEIESITSIRNNQNISINDYGQQLLDLFIAAKLRFLNGTTRGDFQGHIIYTGNKEHSTVDSMLASEMSFLQSGLIQYRVGLNLNCLLDHRPILLKLSSLHPISTH